MQTSWDLSELYQSVNDPAIEADFSRCDTLVKKIETYRGKVATLSSVKLVTLIHAIEELYQTLHKLTIYSSLLASTNSGVDRVTKFCKMIDDRSTQTLKKILFVSVEKRQINRQQWQKHFQSRKLSDYRLTLEHWQREAGHTLEENEEKILAEKSQTSWQTLNHLFDVTTDTLEVIFEDKPITISQCTTLLRDPDPKIRQTAAIALHTALKANNKTTHPIYNALIHDKAISDKLRHYQFSEESRFDEDDVDLETVNAMVKVVESSPLVSDYYHLKKKLLGLDTLMWWDRYAPLPKPTTAFSIPEAVELVLDAFNQFSPQFKQIAQTIINAKHIDWLPSPTKRGGAFCCYGTKDKYPYILLNFSGTFDDVNTLAHELGHGIHDTLAGRSNNWLNVWPSLAIAEIASTFAEELLVEKLMGSPDLSQEDKKSLLSGRIESRIATIHRQVSMFQFERMAHAKRAQEGELSKDDFDNLWHTTIKRPFGNSLKWTEEHNNYWMYIPHIIHTPYYVYSYAFAQLCTLTLVQTYKQTDDKSAFVTSYTNLLKAGGSLTPKANLLGAGLDITKPEFWLRGLKVIENDVNELKKLVESI